jgi:DNA-binding LacI/PurR family transcriptional regulator
MGQQAMKMALSLMTANQEGEEPANIVVQGTLVVRASTVGD